MKPSSIQGAFLSLLVLASVSPAFAGGPHRPAPAAHFSHSQQQPYRAPQYAARPHFFRAPQNYAQPRQYNPPPAQAYRGYSPPAQANNYAARRYQAAQRGPYPYPFAPISPLPSRRYDRNNRFYASYTSGSYAPPIVAYDPPLQVTYAEPQVVNYDYPPQPEPTYYSYAPAPAYVPPQIVSSNPDGEYYAPRRQRRVTVMGGHYCPPYGSTAGSARVIARY